MINFVRTGTFASRVKGYCGGVMLSIRLKLNALCVTAYIGCSVDYHELLEYIKRWNPKVPPFYCCNNILDLSVFTCS